MIGGLRQFAARVVEAVEGELMRFLDRVVAVVFDDVTITQSALSLAAASSATRCDRLRLELEREQRRLAELHEALCCEVIRAEVTR